MSGPKITFSDIYIAFNGKIPFQMLQTLLADCQQFSNLQNADATSTYHKYYLVTFNEKHYDHYKDLEFCFFFVLLKVACIFT